MLPDLTLDPTITEADLEAAHNTDPVDYDAVFAAMAAQLGQDDLEELGSGLIVPASKTKALSNARGLSVSGRNVGVGYCLRTVRQDEWEVPGLYPDAESAWEGAALKHRTSNPLEIPKGATPFWTNGRFGHVALGAGGGMCWTTDYRRSARVDLAPISALASWCGGKLVGWAEDVNGVDCWPNTPKPVPVFDLEDRIAVVRTALIRARARKASPARIEGLEKWLHQLRARRAAQKG